MTAAGRSPLFCGQKGKPLTNNLPYGYMKDAEDKNRWIIDEEAAAVVRRIFAMTVEGMGPYRIAKILSDEKVEKPSYYQAVRGKGCYKNQCDFEHPYAWMGVSIVRMLEKTEYMGDTVNFRSHNVEAVEKKVISNLPALLGMYMTQMQAFSLPVPMGAYTMTQGGMMYGQAMANGTNNGNTVMNGAVAPLLPIWQIQVQHYMVKKRQQRAQQSHRTMI